jgi:XTP/dITP diphosphohydrolase
MTIVLATRNKKKVEEIKRIFTGKEIRFLMLDAFPDCPDIEEDGKTFRANAVKKAVHVASFTNCPAVADDSGLEVFALGGAPGVFSARYAGVGADDKKNVRKLLAEMKNLEKEQRQARFVCCIALALPDRRCRTFTGYARGNIGNRPRGSNGFGYDPLFYPDGHGQTFAEMTDAEKDFLSHRGKALRKLCGYLKKTLQ